MEEKTLLEAVGSHSKFFMFACLFPAANDIYKKFKSVATTGNLKECLRLFGIFARAVKSGDSANEGTLCDLVGSFLGQNGGYDANDEEMGPVLDVCSSLLSCLHFEEKRGKMPFGDVNYYNLVVVSRVLGAAWDVDDGSEQYEEVTGGFASCVFDTELLSTEALLANFDIPPVSVICTLYDKLDRNYIIDKLLRRLLNRNKAPGPAVKETCVNIVCDLYMLEFDKRQTVKEVLIMVNSNEYHVCVITIGSNTTCGTQNTVNSIVMAGVYRIIAILHKEPMAKKVEDLKLLLDFSTSSGMAGIFAKMTLDLIDAMK